MTRFHARARLKKRADYICQRCGFAAMLVCVIIISLVMVVVALEMYNTSGNQASEQPSLFSHKHRSHNMLSQFEHH